MNHIGFEISNVCEATSEALFSPDFFANICYPVAALVPRYNRSADFKNVKPSTMARRKNVEGNN